jgi:hypothetical protein
VSIGPQQNRGVCPAQHVLNGLGIRASLHQDRR